MSEPSPKRQCRSPSPPPFSKSEWPGWSTVESEPAVFNQLLRDIGVQKANVEEIYAIDEDSLSALSPAHGLIFLFRWKPDSVDLTEDSCPENVWFANQVIDNACASFALLNIVFNSDVELGPALTAFKEYSKDLTPPLKGLAVANFEHVRSVHNMFGRKAEMVDADIELMEAAGRKQRAAGGDAGDYEFDEAFHFIAYVHVDGALWELDGLKRQPVKLHTCPKDKWLALVGPSLQQRIAQYNEGELRFNLLAVVPERPGGVATATGEGSYEDIAERRKVDYEEFAHKVAMMLTKEQLAGLIYD